ncbi:response regulator transcription factor [Rhizobium rhizogenes]|uniref:response regulator transcription factor n=1 Tax=Rhizobium rhizogenes TaxID=359 RepID=UPI0015725A1D|nr:response regulator transcription factor [Rhizobium rhizogenes]NTF46157.1 response regulator transcription factor [Rhizobium rhizogenes]
MTKVLLIDDDRELTGLLVEYLAEEGFDARAIDDPRLGLQEATSNSYEIVILDVMMPRINGIDVLQRIRKTSSIPVLMLSARGENVDRITGLNLGADDYVSKPCSPGEIVARLRAIMRRLNRGADPDLDINLVQAGDLILYPSTRSAEWKGQPLDLTGAEFNLLEVLVRNAGQLVSKSEISRRALGRALTPFDRGIDVHVSSIRQKLGLRNDGQSWIRTVRGQGYQLVQDR